MEDGFALVGEAIIEGTNYTGHIQPKCAYFKGVPYILDTDNKKWFISEGDKITIDSIGNKKIIH